MNEHIDPATHLIVIAFVVFYWHLLRIWSQPPPPDQDETAEKKAAAGPAPKAAGVAMQRAAASNATPGPGLLPAAPREDLLSVIRGVDGGFDEKSFLAGAATAYELVVNAYAQEDIGVLERLLAPEIASAFKSAIATRRTRGERPTLTFIGIGNMEIVSAEIEAKQAEISVRFTSEVVAATYAADGSILDGNPDMVVQMTDCWTFARSLESKNPNWKLVATQAD